MHSDIKNTQINTYNLQMSICTPIMIRISKSPNLKYQPVLQLCIDALPTHNTPNTKIYPLPNQLAIKSLTLELTSVGP